MVDPVHAEIHEPIEEELDLAGGIVQYRRCTETVLRIVLCQVIKRCWLRRTIVRIDGSHFLRLFVHVYNDPMIDFTTLARLCNRIGHRLGSTFTDCSTDGPRAVAGSRASDLLVGDVEKLKPHVFRCVQLSPTPSRLPRFPSF